MSQAQSLRDPPRLDGPQKPRGWPLTAAAAGVGGLVATLVPDGRGTDLTVVLLLVTAAHWRCRVETRVPGSTAAHLVPFGLVTSAAGLPYGLGAHLGWLGVVVAAGAVAWMALRERTVSRWLGVVSVLPVLQSALMVVGTDVPGVTALLAPLWLVVAGVGLAMGRSTIVR
jgi:hypothetical protein